MAHVDEPRRVRVGEKVLAPRPAVDLTGPGWHYDAKRRAVAVRFAQPASRVEVTLEW